jgi:hypothetical protein
MRLQHPAVQGVERAAAKEQRVAAVKKPPHNNARMMRPNPTATPNLRSNVIGRSV